MMKIVLAISLLFVTLAIQANTQTSTESGFQGDIIQVEDCQFISFVNPEDQTFFRTACIGAYISTQVINQFHENEIDSLKIKNWLKQTNLTQWSKTNIKNIPENDFTNAIKRAEQILSFITGNSPTNGQSPNSSWIYADPYPSLKEACLADGKDRFHGFLIFNFSFDPLLKMWVTHEIFSKVNCRKT